MTSESGDYCRDPLTDGPQMRASESPEALEVDSGVSTLQHWAPLDSALEPAPRVDRVGVALWKRCCEQSPWRVPSEQASLAQVFPVDV